ncbi:MAG: hypothetical protein R2799_04215, partial [Crocinitomicaceae bacterium]
MNKLILILLVCVSFTAFGQGDPDTGWTVEYEMQRTVKATKRLNELTQTRDTIIPIPKIDYPLISLKRETSFQLQNIEPAKIKLFQNNPKLYKHYLKVGIGSYITPLVQYNFNSGRSRKSNWGVNIDHVSSWLNMKG